MELEIFFSAPPEDLFNICYSSEAFFQVFSNDYNWRERFYRENIPLLEEGVNFLSWYAIYLASRKALERAKFYLSTPKVSFLLSKIQEKEIIFTSSLPDEIISFYSSLSEIGNVRFELVAVNELFYCTFKEKKFNILNSHEISQEEAFFLLFRLAYFKILK